VNNALLTALLVAGALLAPIVTHAADGTSDRKHPAAFVKDSVITTKIKSKLAAEKLSSLAHIRVDTDRDGMVVLSGTAPTQEGVDKAESIARGVDGVISVQNKVKVKQDK